MEYYTTSGHYYVTEDRSLSIVAFTVATKNCAFSLNIIVYCQSLYSNGVGSHVLTTLVTTLPLIVHLNEFGTNTII